MSHVVTRIPPHFQWSYYFFTLQAQHPLELPAFKGSTLRGGLGHTFKRLVCRQPWPCDKVCRSGNDCPYGYIFETTPPDDAKALRNQKEVPRPFIIRPPHDRRTQIMANEHLGFGLTLIGRGNDYLPYFIAVFRELGRVGLGKSRGKCQLLSVEAIQPLTGASQIVYQDNDETIHVHNLTTTTDALIDQARPLSPDQITLNFLTPTRLKHRGHWIKEGPSFQALIKVLLSRVSSLSYFHCGQPFETDFRGLIDRAADVHITHGDTHWQDWSRFSGRQKQRIEMGGLVGQVTYSGDLTDYLPLLVLGQFVHVGKGNVFGNGQYKIEQK